MGRQAEYLPHAKNANQVISLATAWNLMAANHRKAILLIVGMSAELKIIPQGKDYASKPNANFYMNHKWHWLPPEWQEKIGAFMCEWERDGGAR